MANQNEITLKDGGRASIELWSFRDIKEYCERFKAQDFSRRENFEGFSFFGQNKFLEISKNEENYKDCKNLSLLEIQGRRDLKNEYYSRALVALKGEELIGITVLEWIKDNTPFWRYHGKYIDVRSDFRNLGVGTQLVRTLNNAHFIKGKILEFGGTYTVNGADYIKHVIERELKARDYALIGSDYPLLAPPREFGVYNSIGRKIRLTSRERDTIKSSTDLYIMNLFIE